MPNPLKILIAPSAYKGSLTAQQIAAAISQGLLATMPDAQIRSMPLADGGDGTIAAIQAGLGGSIKRASVTGPLDKQAIASWLVLPDKIIIELAQCCGLAMIKGQPLQPLHAHTYGLGEVISHCLSQANKRIFIGVGGSASTDGGTAALSALGIKFLDGDKNSLPFGGASLTRLNSIDLSQLDKRVEKQQIDVLTDVNSPLLGTNGASAVFAPQKGADDKQIKILESGLMHLADIVQDLTGNDLRNIPGTGAAGGTAFGLASLLKAKILPGFKTIAELIDIKAAIDKSDLVITAEGRLDHQSLSGKATGELAKMCKSLNKPLWVFPASAQENIDWQSSGIDAVYPTAQTPKQAESKDINKAVRQIADKLIAVRNFGQCK